MRILILHEIDDFRSARRTSVNHAFCLLKYAPQHEYTLHSARQPVTSRLREEAFDAIILDTTFLCWRWAKPKSLWLDRILHDYDFVARSDAVKVALPQDEYDHSAVLDRWLADWKVDLIYSVCHEQHDRFYPQAGRHARIVEGLTGYVDDADVRLMQTFARPFGDRAIDVGYRARSLPAYFGRAGRMKTELGHLFREAMASRDLKLDISTDARETLVGDDWIRFLGNCKFTLGCESGSSVIDPEGEVRARVERHLQRHPGASFEEVEQACFPDQTSPSAYVTAGPRLFEAAMARSCQILVPGSYLGVLRPGEHYVAWSPELSPADDVYEQLRDDKANEARIEACYRVLIADPRFRYTTFVKNLLGAIGEIGAAKGRWRLGSERCPASGDEIDLREAFTVAVLTANRHHVADMKEIRFVPNFLHTIAVGVGRVVLALMRRIVG